MKYLYIIIFGFLLHLSVYSQSWRSSNVLMGDADITEIKSTIASDGSLIILGHFNGIINTSFGDLTTTGGKDYFIARFLSDGTLAWIKNLGSAANEYILGGICACVNNNIYVTGGFKNVMYYTDTDSLQSKGNDDIFLVKYDLNGNVDWGRNIGSGAKAQRPNALKVDNNSNILLTGFFADSIEFDSLNTLYTDDGTSDFFIGKFDSENGNPIWIKQFFTLGGSSAGRFFDIGINDNYYALSGTITDSISIENDTIVSNNHSIDMQCTLMDTAGNFQWIRKIGGANLDYCYSVSLDDEDNIYIGGYYNSDTIFIDENETVSVQHNENKGDYDIVISKYSVIGELQWYKTAGGKARDKIYDITYFDDNINVAGHFTDSLYWGGILLKTEGAIDSDMLTASLDKLGNFRSANSYHGRNNSDDESRAIFEDGGNLYTVMRTNTDLLELGEDSYISTSGKYFIAMGVIGCNPISIDNSTPSNVSTCYGDSSGSILITAAGGFGSPWQYSIDNGNTYKMDNPYFGDLPAGDYPIVVIDKENCAHAGEIITLTQPEPLGLTVETVSDITNEANGEIFVSATGGTLPYTFTLLPNGIQKIIGSFEFGAGDSGMYVVQVNDKNYCGPVSSDTIEIKDLTHVIGIEDLMANNVMIYPNPASNVINLEMLYEGSEATLEVLSLTGQVVMSRLLYSSSGKILESINVSDLSKGMYMLRINGRTLNSRIVVN